MPHPERHPSHRRSASNEPLHPTPLPEVLAEFLKDQHLVGLLHGTEELGTIVVVKAPAKEIRSLVGPVAIEVQHELHDTPTAPVVRTVVKLYNQPATPLSLEMFTKVADDTQRDEFAKLAEQESLHLLFYDEKLRNRLTKRLTLRSDPVKEEILTTAERRAAEIPKDQFDFDRAKAAVIEKTRL